MVIAIDISQIVYEGTGVGNYVKELVREMTSSPDNHTFILFGSSFSLRKKFVQFYKSLDIDRQKVKLYTCFFPPSMLDLMWNVLHIIPVEWFIGRVDIFFSSDWTQPPLVHAKGITTIHDLTPFRYPETFSKKIISVHKRKLERSKRLCKAFLCDSLATKKDAQNILGIDEKKLFVVYPGRFV